VIAAHLVTTFYFLGLFLVTSRHILDHPHFLLVFFFEDASMFYFVLGSRGSRNTQNGSNDSWHFGAE
jgi:hypothetical protein